MGVFALNAHLNSGLPHGSSKRHDEVVAFYLSYVFVYATTAFVRFRGLRPFATHDKERRDKHTMEEEFSYKYSLDRNTINIFGPIDDEMAERVIMQMQYLDDKGAEEIIVQINSPGGSVSAGLAIYDTMNYVKARIVTVGLGMAASMGAFLLSAGSRGYRRATENCEILIHQPLGGASGQASDIIIAAQHIEKTRARLNRILSENTGKVIDAVARDTDRDYIMTSAEALDYGIIDEVLKSTNKAASKS